MEVIMKRIVVAIVFLTLMISFHGQLFAKGGNSIETALKAYNRGDFQRAVDLLKEQVKQRPDAGAYYLIGYGLYSLGRYNEASEFFSQAYLIDPDFTPDKHNLPRVPEKTGGLSAKKAEPAKKVAEKQKETAKKAVPEEVKREVKKEVKTGPPPTEAEVKEATKPRAPEERKQPEQKQAVQPPAVTPRQAPEKAFKPATPFPQGKQQAGRPPSGLGILLLTGFYTTFFIIGVLLYLFFALCLFLIAKKLSVPAPWTAWIPLVQIWTFVASAGKPWWWILLLLIPFVNYIIGIYLWMCISENLGKNKWLGLLMIVPVVNFIFFGYLAFSKSGNTYETFEADSTE